MPPLSSLEAVADHDRAIVFGIGGGGDIVGAYPTAALAELLGLEVLLGGVAWERAPRDRRPGPRPLDELAAIDRVADRVAVATPETATDDGVRLAEAGVAATVPNTTLVLDVSAGPRPLVDSIDAVCREWDVDLVIGVDAGGDALAVGPEPGVRSPLSDAIGVATLAEVAVPAALGVIGYGSDGELTPEELDEGVAALGEADAILGAWGITPSIAHTLEELVSVVDTEASRIPLDAARGTIGPTTIRDGARSVEVTPASLVTFYFDPVAVDRRSEVTGVVSAAPSVESAAETLRSRGIQTEYDTERARLSEGP